MAPPRAPLLAIVAVAACHAAPQPIVLALAPNHAPLPPYGGVVWTTECRGQAMRVSASERAARLAAMATWFPGATIELTQLGDRARRVHFAGRAEIPRKRADAEALGRRVMTIVGPLFDVASTLRDTAVARTADAWFVDFALEAMRAHTVSQREHATAGVVRIDRHTGDVRVGLAGALVPDVTPCRHGAPVVDGARARAQIVGRPMPGEPDRTIRDEDIVVASNPVAEHDGAGVRGVAFLIVGPDLVARANSDDPSDAKRAERGMFAIDPISLEVLGERPILLDHDVYDPIGIRLDPRYDAMLAFGRDLAPLPPNDDEDSGDR